MKKTLLLILPLLIISCLSFLTASNDVYISQNAFSSSLTGSDTQNSKPSPDKKEKARDLKIPDDVKKTETNYNFRSNYGNTELGTDKKTSAAEPQQEPRLVVIDAGHGGNDAGTRDNGLAEKDITLDISRRLDSILKHAGVRTYMIRTDDKYSDHKDRIQTANDKNAALYISIHCDWFKDSSYHGTTTLYYPSKSLSIGGLVEIDYARIIQNELIKALQTKDRGISDRSDLAVLRRATMPSILVELCFLSNKNDAALIASEEFRQKAAEAMAEGIKKALAKIDEK